MPTGQPIENFEAHFWGLVDQSGGYESCWSWRLAPTKWGYGQIQMGSRKRRAHQVAWILTHGREIPDGLVIDHICHNDSGCPVEVKPAHTGFAAIRHISKLSLRVRIYAGVGTWDATQL